MTHEGLPDQERHIVREVFAAGERQVRDAMLPRAQIDFLDAASPGRTTRPAGLGARAHAVPGHRTDPRTR